MFPSSSPPQPLSPPLSFRLWFLHPCASSCQHTFRMRFFRKNEHWPISIIRVNRSVSRLHCWSAKKMTSSKWKMSQRVSKKFLIDYVKSKYWPVCSPQLHSCPWCAEAVQRRRERERENVNQARLPFSSLVDSQPSGFVLENVQTWGR